MIEMPGNLLDFFPLPHIREKQATAIGFCQRMIERGIRDIIIAAPTGFGKTATGSTLGFWAAQREVKLPGQPGAYMLCTQKMLQDQIETEIEQYPKHLKSAVSLKTASEYGCPEYQNCGTGMRNKPICF